MIFFRTLLAAAAVVGSAVAAPAAAITDSAFTYSPPKTGYIAVSNLDFAPAVAENAVDWQNDAVDGLRGKRCFMAGLNLPQGAKITAVRVSFRTEIFFYVGFYSRETEVYSAPVRIEQTGPVDTRVDYTGTPDASTVVDNVKNTLGLRLCMTDTAARFYGARVTYTYANAGD